MPDLLLRHEAALRPPSWRGSRRSSCQRWPADGRPRAGRGRDWLTLPAWLPGTILALLTLLGSRAGETPTAPHARPSRPRVLATLRLDAFVGEVVFSPDGRTLATNVEDRVVLWEVASWRVRASFRWPGDSSGKSITFSPDGKSLAAVDLRAVRVWDLPTGQSRLVWKDRRPPPDSW